MIEKFRGCILGLMSGDILGSAVEGARKKQIADKDPNGLIDFKHGPRGYGKYTDDSEMTLALMKSLVRKNGLCDPKDCAESYAADFNVSRGYGATTIHILRDLKNGDSYLATPNRYIKEGSYANGSVMRIAPIGLLFQNLDNDILIKKVFDAIRCTHTNMFAIDAAYLQAAAVAYLCKESVETFDLKKFLDYLETLPKTHELAEKIKIITQHIFELKNTDWKTYLQSNNWTKECQLSEILSDSWFQIKAIDAFCCSLVAFCYHWNDPEDAIIAAVHYGGDTDTLGAITGALAFSLHGSTKLPKRWLDNIENRDLAIELCDKLYNIFSNTN